MGGRRRWGWGVFSFFLILGSVWADAVLHYTFTILAVFLCMCYIWFISFVAFKFVFIVLSTALRGTLPLGPRVPPAAPVGVQARQLVGSYRRVLSSCSRRVSFSYLCLAARCGSSPHLQSYANVVVFSRFPCFVRVFALWAVTYPPLGAPCRWFRIHGSCTCRP